ncbi:GFOD2 isoform 6, partial [Pan troglodytes]
KTEEEAKQLAEEMNIAFYTSRTDDILLHQDVDLVCISIPPPLTRQISVKALGSTCGVPEWSLDGRGGEAQVHTLLRWASTRRVLGRMWFARRQQHRWMPSGW